MEYTLNTYNKTLEDLIDQMRIDHPKSTEVKLVNTNFIFNLVSKGQIGEVIFVDNYGGLHVKFKNQVVILHYLSGDRWEINSPKNPKSPFEFYKKL